MDGGNGKLELTRLFDLAVRKRASDILLTVGAPPMLRIHGELAPVQAPVFDRGSVQKTVYGILNNDQVARFEREKELDFSLLIQERYRFRGNLFYQRGSVGAAFRMIPTRIPSLDSLGLPPIVEELSTKAQGLALITGPTGHGKSTTQAAMIDRINATRRCHIVTVEDPIEFLHGHKKSVIEQREVGQDTHSFAEALKHVLRQDPDVILIGEMRDPITIATALTAAETGHLVISTLHTNDAVQAVDRMIDTFPSHQQPQVRSQLSLSLLAVVAQRLLPKADASGRVVACEILVNNPAAAHLLRDGKTHNLYTVMETHAKEGMVTMDQTLKRLYQQGTVTYEETRRHMRNPSDLRK